MRDVRAISLCARVALHLAARGRSTAAFGETIVALSELGAARVGKALDAFMVKRRPPANIRAELDLGYRISGQSVEIFEIRPAWRGKPGEKRESAVAKTTFVRSRGMWRVFWMRRDLRWHGYEPAPEVASIEEFCALVAEDAYAYFFG